MRTLLMPIAFLTVFSAVLLLVGWTITRGVQPADAAHSILVVTPDTMPAPEAGASLARDDGWERADEIGGIC